MEAMPWSVPNDGLSYERLIEAVDREQFAVHFDPANLIDTVGKYYDHDDLIGDFLARLGPLLKSAHAKDIALEDGMPPVRFHDCAPGAGNLAWDVLVPALANLDAGMPLLLEHLATNAEYRGGAEHLRRTPPAGHGPGRRRTDIGSQIPPVHTVAEVPADAVEVASHAQARMHEGQPAVLREHREPGRARRPSAGAEGRVGADVPAALASGCSRRRKP